jgi:hypothetical protein
VSFFEPVSVTRLASFRISCSPLPDSSIFHIILQLPILTQFAKLFLCGSFTHNLNTISTTESIDQFL